MVFFTVSSYNRTNGTDDDFSMISNQTVSGFKMVRLSKYVISNTLYNVNSNNNSFTFSIDDNTTPVGPLTVTLTEQNYTIATLTAALQTAINTALGVAGVLETATITFNVNTARTTITMSGSNVLIQVNADSGKGLNLMLGFRRNSDTDFAQTLVSPRVYNVTKYSSLFLYSNILHPNGFNSNTSQRAALLDMIPISDSEFGSIFTYQPKNNVFLPLNESFVNNLQFSLRDDLNQRVDLNGGFQSITLELV